MEDKAMIYKRGKFYWYKFMWDGRLVRESTKQGNDKVARNMESAHRTSQRAKSASARKAVSHSAGVYRQSIRAVGEIYF
jgi:hypothetical protein